MKNWSVRFRNSAIWNDENRLVELCAHHLRQGSLSLVLGAGVSMACGLPDWAVLVKRMFKITKTSKSNKMSNEKACDFLFNDVCRGNDTKFAELTRKALFENYNSDAKALSGIPLLRALGALVMSSHRGSVSQIVSYNFDDLIEEYLAYHGYRVSSVGWLPRWRVAADVIVYHPHGLLPAVTARKASPGIVMAQTHFDRVIGDTKDLWNALQRDFLASHFCLFVGLSGDDNNLASLLTNTREDHVSRTEKLPYRGIRLGTALGKEQQTFWKSRHVYPHAVRSYDALPDFLFRICQQAALL